MDFRLNISNLLILFNNKEKKKLLYLFLLMFINGTLEILGISLIIPLVSFLIEPDKNSIFISNFKELFKIENSNILFFLIIFFLVFQIIKVLFVIFYSWIEINYIYNFKKKISSNLLKTYLSNDYKFFKSNNSSRLIRNVTHGVEMVSLFLMQFLKISLDSILLIFIFLFLLLYNYKITLIAFLILLLISISYFFVLKDKLLDLGIKRQIFLGKKLQYFQESIENIKWIKISNKENFFLQKFNIQNDNIAKSSITSDFLKNLPRFFLEVLGIFFISIILLNYFHNHLNGQNKVFEILAVFLAAIYRLMPSVSRIMSGIQNLKNTYPEVITLSSEIKKTYPLPVSFSKVHFNKEIKIKINNFFYDQEKKFILKDIFFKINKNEKIGIIGSSGSGKSTLIDLILGIVEIQDGQVEVDNQLIKKDNLNEWHKLIGYVPQKITIIEDSIKNNILFGSLINQELEGELKILINQINLKKFVDSQINGIDSLISEKGLNISGGEMQRIAICRALLRKPQIIILDEATSALDTDNENQIINYLNILKNKTIIFVSHRMSTLKYCDKIYKLEDNKFYQINKNEYF